VNPQFFVYFLFAALTNKIEDELSYLGFSNNPQIQPENVFPRMPCPVFKRNTMKSKKEDKKDKKDKTKINRDILCFSLFLYSLILYYFPCYAILCFYFYRNDLYYNT